MELAAEEGPAIATDAGDPLEASSSPLLPVQLAQSNETQRHERLRHVPKVYSATIFLVTLAMVVAAAYFGQSRTVPTTGVDSTQSLDGLESKEQDKSEESQMQDESEASLQDDDLRDKTSRLCIAQGSELDHTLTADRSIQFGVDTLSLGLGVQLSVATTYRGDKGMIEWSWDTTWNLRNSPQGTRTILPLTPLRRALDSKSFKLAFQDDGNLVAYADGEAVWATGILPECAGGGKCVLLVNGTSCNVQILNASWKGDTGGCGDGHPSNLDDLHDIQAVWTLLGQQTDRSANFCDARMFELKCFDKFNETVACRLDEDPEGSPEENAHPPQSRVEALSSVPKPLGASNDKGFLHTDVTMNISCRAGINWLNAWSPCLYWYDQAFQPFPWNAAYVSGKQLLRGQALPETSLNNKVSTIAYSIRHEEYEDHVEETFSYPRAPSVKYHEYWVPLAGHPDQKGIKYKWNDIFDRSFFCEAEVTDKPSLPSALKKYGSGAKVKGGNGLLGATLADTSCGSAEYVHRFEGEGPHAEMSTTYYETTDGVPCHKEASGEYIGSLRASFQNAQFMPPIRTVRRRRRKEERTKEDEQVLDDDTILTDGAQYVIKLFATQSPKDKDIILFDPNDTEKGVALKDRHTGNKTEHWQAALVSSDSGDQYVFQNSYTGQYLCDKGKANAFTCSDAFSWTVQVSDQSKKKAAVSDAKFTVVSTDGRKLCRINDAMSLDVDCDSDNEWLFELTPFPRDCMSFNYSLEYLSDTFKIQGLFDNVYGLMFDPEPGDIETVWRSTVNATKNGTVKDIKRNNSVSVGNTGDDKNENIVGVDDEPEEQSSAVALVDGTEVLSSAVALADGSSALALSDELNISDWKLDCESGTALDLKIFKIGYDCCFIAGTYGMIRMMNGFSVSMSMPINPFISMGGQVGVVGWLPCASVVSHHRCLWCDQFQVYGCISMTVNPLAPIKEEVKGIPVVEQIVNAFDVFYVEMCLRGIWDFNTPYFVTGLFYFAQLNVPQPFMFFAKVLIGIYGDFKWTNIATPQVFPLTNLFISSFKVDEAHFFIRVEISFLWWSVRKSLYDHVLWGASCTSPFGFDDGYCDDPKKFVAAAAQPAATDTPTPAPTPEPWHADHMACIDQGEKDITFENHLYKMGKARLIPQEDGNLVMWSFDMAYAIWSTFQDDQSTRSTISWNTSRGAPYYDHRDPSSKMKFTLNTEGYVVLTSTGDGDDVEVWKTPKLCETRVDPPWTPWYHPTGVKCHLEITDQCNIIVAPGTCDSGEKTNSDPIWSLFDSYYTHDFCGRRAGGALPCNWHDPTIHCEDTQKIFKASN